MIFLLQMGTPCKPECGCFNKLTQAQRQSIYDEYYTIDSYRQKNQYLMGMMSRREVKRSRQPDPTKPPKIQWNYSVLDNKKVCRHAFKSLHGISESKLVHISKLKKESPQNIAPQDMRGKSKFSINIFIEDNVKYLFNRPSC